MSAAISTIDHQKKGPGKSLLRTAGNVAFVILTIIGLLLAAYMLQIKFLGEDSAVLKFKLFIVLSGSMSPEFDPGSVVLVRDIAPEEIAVDDILTFRPSAESKNIVTHRVAALEYSDGMEIITKGDANDSEDPLPIRPENVIGKVFFSIPYLGYLLNFAGTNYGLYSLIILPSLALIIYEIFRIITYLRKGRSEQGEQQTETAVPEVFTEVLADVFIEETIENKQPALNTTKAVRVFAGSEGIIDAKIHQKHLPENNTVTYTLAGLTEIVKDLATIQHEIHSTYGDHRKEKLLDCKKSLTLLLEEF